MGKQIYCNTFMLTDTYKTVSSQFSFAGVNLYLPGCLKRMAHRFFPQKNGPSSILAKYFGGKFLKRMDLSS